MIKESFKIASAVYYSEDEHIFFIGLIHNNELAYRKAAHSNAKILITDASHMGETGK